MSAPKDVDVRNEHRIVGPPGTGKTTTLTATINDLTKNQGVRSADILVVSFTRAAAAEIASRGTDIPRENISTLHAAGRRAIGGNFDVAESHVRDWNESTFGKRFPLSYVSTGDEDGGLSDAKSFGTGDDIYNRVNLLRARMLSEALWPNDLKIFAKAWREWKRANNLIDYADMIEIPLRDQLPPPGKPRYGIFDEFQDFTAAESALARFWGAQMQRTVIAGDPDQTIFQFKGASSKHFDEPAVPEEQIRVLEQSYRVPAQVQRVAEAWIGRVQKRIPRTYRPRPEQGEVRFIHYENGGKLLEGDAVHGDWAHTWRHPGAYLNDALDRYVSKGKRVMFLATCGFMLEPMIDWLRDEGIPFFNPYRKAKSAWNPLGTPPTGIGATERLLSFLRMSTDVWGEADTHVWTLEEYWRWIDTLKMRGVLTHMGKTHTEIKEMYESARDLDPDRLSQQLDVVEHLMRWMPESALDRAMEQDLDWFESNLESGRQDGFRYPLAVARKHGGAALRSEPQIIVSTIHSVKGGWSDAVYVFPDLSNIGGKEWDNKLTRDSLIRLFYVGMTRAKESLIVCKPSPMKHVPLDSLFSVVA